MEPHFRLSDDELELQLQHTSLTPDLFSHEAHLRLAWIHIKKYGVEKAIQNISLQLHRYVTLLGAGNKFNLTLTVAAIKAMNHLILRSDTNEFSELIVEFPRLKTQFKDLIETHYSKQVYHSVAAREKYLEPDLLSFD